MDEFLDKLRTSPEDGTDLHRPSVDDDQLNAALFQLFQDEVSTSTRNAVLQVVSTLSPRPEWSEPLLAWAGRDPQAAPSQDQLIRYTSSALGAGVFPRSTWMHSLGSPSGSSQVLRQIALQWSQLDLDSFLDACGEEYKVVNARLDVARLLIATVLDAPYEPTDSASTTIMAKIAVNPFIDILIQSLLVDTGNTLFSLNLRMLLNILPYAPFALTPKVPLMAVILGRAVSWRDRPFIDDSDTPREGVTRTPLPSETKWDVFTTAQEPMVDLPEQFKPRKIAQLFLVAMYGAWPSNVIAFVRDPSSYIRGKNVPPVYVVDWEHVWQPGLLARRIEPMIREFRLHPTLVVFTSTAELADDKRWDKIDAAEFIARSQALANADQQGPATIDFFDEDDEEAGDGPSDLSGRLETENDLLRSEAKFTNRVRKQYLHHISRLHKTSLRLNNDEAEIHSFVNRLKAQANQITELTAQLSQARTDASQAQQKHVKWQGQLRDKVASFREEKATWQTEAARIRAELSEAHATAKAQRVELAEVKNERFKLQNQLTEVEPKIRHISDYETRMKQLTESQWLWDEDVRRCKGAQEEAEMIKGKCYELDKMLRASRQDVEEQARTISALERKGPVPVLSAPSKHAEEPPQVQDLSLYVKLLEEAKSRNEKLERENLELRTELNGKPKEDGVIRGDRSFIWGEADAE